MEYLPELKTFNDLDEQTKRQIENVIMELQLDQQAEEFVKRLCTLSYINGMVEMSHVVKLEKKYGTSSRVLRV